MCSYRSGSTALPMRRDYPRSSLHSLRRKPLLVVGLWAVGVAVAYGGEGVSGHVAAGDLPLVVLFGQGRADEADDGGTVGEDPDHVGASADLFVQPFQRVVAAQLPPVGPGVMV